MRAIGAVLSLLVVIPLSAQTVTINFEQLLNSVPLGTRVDQLKVPGIPFVFAEGCGHALPVPCSGHWLVDEAVAAVPPGVNIVIRRRARHGLPDPD